LKPGASELWVDCFVGSRFETRRFRAQGQLDSTCTPPHLGLEPQRAPREVRAAPVLDVAAPEVIEARIHRALQALLHALDAVLAQEAVVLLARHDAVVVDVEA
jgi:hypothetical protein